MKRFEAQEAWLPAGYLSRYAAAVQKFMAREDRFAARELLTFVAATQEGFEVRAAADGVTEVLLYDEIGYWGVTAKDFVLALAAAGSGPIRLRINSPGGDTFDALAIYNALKARTTPVTVAIDGIAASAASVIAMAGSRIEMPEQALMMIHNCWGVCMGNRNDMIEFAAVQEKIDGQMAAIYAKKCGKPAADMAAAMDAETWYTSTEAKQTGLCDAVIDAAPAPAALAARHRPQLAARLVASAGRARLPRIAGEALPPYDPDGDGDNDAENALGMMRSAMILMSEACDALCGTCENNDEDAGGDAAPGMPSPMVPGTHAAATEPEWVVGAAEDLPVDDKASWDGPAAAERMLDAAGFNGNSPDPAKAKRGFLVYDHHNPKLKGSYKLPFSDLVGGELKAVKGGIDAAASRLPQTDIPDDVKQRARAVLDAYEKKMNPDEKAALALRRARLRLAAAEAV